VSAGALSPEWVQLAGAYETAANAVRAADYDDSITTAEYGALVDAREQAFAAISAVPAVQIGGAS